MSQVTSVSRTLDSGSGFAKARKSYTAINLEIAPPTCLHCPPCGGVVRPSWRPSRCSCRRRRASATACCPRRTASSLATWGTPGRSRGAGASSAAPHPPRPAPRLAPSRRWRLRGGSRRRRCGSRASWPTPRPHRRGRRPRPSSPTCRTPRRGTTAGRGSARTRRGARTTASRAGEWRGRHGPGRARTDPPRPSARTPESKQQRHLTRVAPPAGRS